MSCAICDAKIRKIQLITTLYIVEIEICALAAKLLDSNGVLKPFDRWLNDVLPIASHQCGSWLRTEYDTAVIRAQQAAEWKRFERDKDVLPNLKWVPSTSPNPGADHRIYWGTILPVDHSFWSRHRPGDRWNCQCSLESTDEPATGIKHEDAVDPRKNGPQKGLKDNPGKTGNLFGQDHPYYPESCSSCSFAGGLTNRLGMIFRGQKRDCNRCSKLLARLPEKTDEKMSAAKDYYNKLDKDKNYIKVEINDKGGVTATHIGHNEDTGKKEFFGNTMSGADLERECVRGLYNDGNWVELLDESKKAPDGNAYTALDMRLNNVLMDIKSITKPSENYSWSLFGKDKQLYKYNKRPDITETANSVCLYFHDPAYFSHDKMWEQYTC